MAPTTATRENGNSSLALGPALAVATGDAVTHRRITAALVEGGCLATADSAVVDPALEGVHMIVLAVDLSDPEAAAALRAICEASPEASVVVVTPPGRDWEIRRALRAGARGIVFEGATNREIADRLYLAERTVKSHLSTAFTKLGVRSRAEAAALVLDPDERPIDVFAHPPAGDELALGANGSRGGSI
jgi:DNA-binding NarL/FixJ family response regulator